ncbi:hypothetical protein XPN_3339, partial [Xanthomonas arboricola pv. pruni MAFF 301427]
NSLMQWVKSELVSHFCTYIG